MIWIKVIIINVCSEQWTIHCMKRVHIQSFSGPYLVRMRENTDQKNSKHGHFSGSGSCRVALGTTWPIFSKFPIFSQLISLAFRLVKQQQNMKSEENIGNVVRDWLRITSLLLTYVQNTICLFIIYQGK